MKKVFWWIVVAVLYALHLVNMWTIGSFLGKLWYENIAEPIIDKALDS